MQVSSPMLRAQSANILAAPLSISDDNVNLSSMASNGGILSPHSANTLPVEPVLEIKPLTVEVVKEEKTPVPLNQQNLSRLSDKVSIPTYDRSALRAGIVHIGQGNFHRSHMASYLDDLFHLDFENNKEWAIVGGGIMSFDADKRNLLQSQDWLQTLVQQDGDSSKAKVIGSMIDFLPVDADGRSLLAAMISPGIKIVSLTVTEGGYFLNNGAFDPNHPQIQHDINSPDQPKTCFGMMIKALRIRQQAGMQPFTVLSCDNIPHNGRVVQSVLLGIASAIDPAFAQWMKEHVACPNSMVDRITPGTTDKQRNYCREELGCEDAAPIFCEPYRQWVLEDNFPQGRPNLELLENVTFVPDVAPYEFMKIRILNGGHASLCYPSALLGVKYVHEAMEHRTIRPFLDALERDEIIPTVGPVPDTSLSGYYDLIASRFANPTICDTITRICFGGASNQPKFTIPVAADNLKAGRKVDGIALVSAMWCKYCQGKTEAGDDIGANDPQWDRLQSIALQASSNPQHWLTSLPDVYGSIGNDPTFAASFAKALHTIQNEGAEAAMKQYISA